MKRAKRFAKDCEKHEMHVPDYKRQVFFDFGFEFMDQASWLIARLKWEDVYYYKNAARKAFNEGNFRKARGILKKAILQSPESPE